MRDPSPRSARLFASRSALTSAEALAQGTALDLTLDTVHSLIAELRLNYSDVEIVIVHEPAEIAYLDHQGACARTPGEKRGEQVRLGRAAFADRETLAATLAHELTHLVQCRSGRYIGSDNLAELEAEAYAGERAVVDRLGDPS